MPTIVRIEDLVHVPQLTSGAITYISQNGLPYNATLDDFSKLITNSGNFATVANLQTTGQTLYGYVLTLSGNLTASGQYLYNYITDVNTRLDITGRTLYNYITGVSGLIQSGQNLYFITGTSGLIQLTGQTNYNLTTGLSGKLDATGTSLQNQINSINSNTGIRTIINNLSGNINLIGTGGIIITNGINNTINISGSGIIPAKSISTAIDWSLGNVFYTSVSTNTTFTFNNNKDGQVIVLSISGQNSGIVLSWPNSVRFPGGNIPIPTSGSTDVYTFVQIGTSTIYGNAVQVF